MLWSIFHLKKSGFNLHFLIIIYLHHKYDVNKYSIIMVKNIKSGFFL